MSASFLTPNAIAQFGLYFAALIVLIQPLGLYMARVYEGKIAFLAPLERLCFALCGINPAKEMQWRHYAASVLALSLCGMLLLFFLLLLQGVLPLNPQALPGLPADLAFNIAASFTTNTNWQSYSPETTLSNLSQMAGLGVQSFLAAATGMSVLVALVRGFTRKNAKTIGNFWVDTLRGILYILLPLSLALSLALASQGVVQSFGKYVEYQPVEMSGVRCQVTEEKSDTCHPSPATRIPLGPAASQIAIKQLGSNGGGFFNANSAHPFENPTPLSNFLEMLSILLIPAALCYSFGVLVRDRRQGFSLLSAMTIIFLPLLLLCLAAEQQGSPLLSALGIDQAYGALQSGGNMEGKEVRFGIANSTLWTAATAATSNGSVNSMLDSYTPIGGMVPLLLMHFSEVVYGGVGCGLYSMLIFVLLAVFIAGLMVGRTPEYLGKKIQAFEMKMASLAILMVPLAALIGTCTALLTQAGRAGMLNHGAHGFSEILYAFTSAANNNGSAFAGINANTPFYNIALALCMLIGRFWIMVPVLAIAGSLAAKNTVPPSAGTLPTHTPLFVAVLVGVVILIGVLTYVPTLALGPIADYFRLLAH